MLYKARLYYTLQLARPGWKLLYVGGGKGGGVEVHCPVRVRRI